MNTRWLSLVAASLALCSVSSQAWADAPPMPPCPAGYTQVGAMECRAPFACPNGWILTHGPKCIPWTCKEGQGCGHPRNQCVEATLCVNDKGTPSRFCDDARSCEAGESCKPQSVCSGGGAKAAFVNWTPAGTGTAAPAPTNGAATTGRVVPEPAPKHGGCGSCSSTNAKAPSLGDGALALLLGLLVIRPRARRALRSSPSRR